MYFDVLFTCHLVGDEDTAWYLVRTYRADSLAQAIAWGKREARKLRNPGRRGVFYSQRFWTAGYAGEFDNFISKNVGEFIEVNWCQEG